MKRALFWAWVSLAAAPLAAQLDVDGLAASATGGDADAAFRLGRAYRLGDGVPADGKIAEHWLEKAARRGHARAADDYGLVLLQNGKPREALPWLKKAAERGDPRAQYGLATVLFGGGAGSVDARQARAWMQRAARAGLPAAAEALAIMDKPGALAPAAAARPYDIVTVQPAKATAVALPGRWVVQVGAFAKPENARRYWRQMRPATSVQAAFPVRDGLTRLRIGPFASRDDARRFCAAQRMPERDCFAVKSEGG